MLAESVARISAEWILKIAMATLQQQLAERLSRGRTAYALEERDGSKDQKDVPDSQQGVYGQCVCEERQEPAEGDSREVHAQVLQMSIELFSLSSAFPFHRIVRR